MAYDTNNIFAKIIRGDLPSTKVFENDVAVSFRDIHPLAPIHVLVVPKGQYKDQYDFMSRASETEIVGFARALAATAEKAGLLEEGYRAISNSGVNGAPEVPHYHVHLLGGGPLGRMIAKKD